MRKKVYKKIDSIERIFANFWEIFPNLTVGTFNDNVIQPFLQKSIEFCNLKQNGTINIVGRLLGAGGFGNVGPLGITEDGNILEEMYGIIVSRKENLSFEPFYVPIIVKTSNQPKLIDNNWTTESLDGNYIISIPDPLSEIIFGGMLGFLYDSGICPGVSKYFGSYGCPVRDNYYSISIITEQSNLTFFSLLTRQIPSNMPLFNPEMMINFLFQYVYTIYVSKYYLGFSHFDTHLFNIMFTYLHNNEINIPNQTPIDYVYKGEKINNKKYILIKYPGLLNGRETYIAIKNNGLLLKIIDYGICTSYLNHSQSDIIRTRLLSEDRVSSTNIVVSADNLNLIGMSDGNRLIEGTTAFDAFISGINNDSQRNTHEIQYLLNNLYEVLSKGIDRISRTNNPIDPYDRIYIDSLRQFSSLFYGNAMYDVANLVRGNEIRQINNLWDQMSRNRNVGQIIPGFENPNELLVGLIRVCNNLGHIYDNGQQVFYYLENDIIPSNIKIDNSLILDPLNMLDNSTLKFLQTEYENQIDCNNGDREACNIIKKNDPNTLLEKPLLSSTIDLFENGKLNNILSDDLNTYLRVSDYDSNLKIYSIQINPSGVVSSKSDPEDFVYRSYQQWFDLKNITDKDGDYLQTVHINIAILNQTNNQMQSNIISKYTDGRNVGGLWEISNDLNINNFDNYFITNGGYFTVQKNIINQTIANNLVPGASLPNMDFFNPIGFYYNINDIENSGTTIPIPKSYRNYFAFITKRNGIIGIEDYTTFYDEFTHKQIPLLYKLDDGSFYATTQNIIQLENGNTYGGRPILNNGEILPIGPGLEFAFCSGPVLIRDRNVVFDLNTMINKEFAIVEDDIPNVIQPRNADPVKPPNLTSYKLVFDAPNDYMFKPGENDGNQIYGMRHSSRFMIHNVLGIKEDGQLIFIMIEGRGYSAPGLDRVQLANLVQKFDIVHAVSLDGGFSANAVFKVNGGEKSYLIEDPQKRPLGISMIFKWNSGMMID